MTKQSGISFFGMKWLALTLLALPAGMTGVSLALSGGRSSMYLAAALLPVSSIYAMAWPLGWKAGRFPRWISLFCAAGIGFSGWLALFLVVQMT